MSRSIIPVAARLTHAAPRAADAARTLTGSPWHTPSPSHSAAAAPGTKSPRIPWLATTHPAPCADAYDSLSPLIARLPAIV